METKDPTPALTRGLTLLRRLEAIGPSTLERLVSETALPKSSVARLLTTLERTGAVRRDPVTRRYHQQLRLVPVASSGSRIEAIPSVAIKLCETVGQTVELYAFRDSGLTMIDRWEPAHAEVAVRARRGFVRHLDELEALSQVAHAFADPSLIPDVDQYWVWRNGKRQPISSQQRDEIVEEAQSQGFGIDREPNKNGVRRYAAPVFEADGSLAGILAIGQVVSSVNPDVDLKLAESVRRAVALPR